MKNAWVLERFAAVDRKDIDGFIDMLSHDHQFIFGDPGVDPRTGHYQGGNRSHEGKSNQ